MSDFKDVKDNSAAEQKKADTGSHDDLPDVGNLNPVLHLVVQAIERVCRTLPTSLRCSAYLKALACDIDRQPGLLAGTQEAIHISYAGQPVCKVPTRSCYLPVLLNSQEQGDGDFHDTGLVVVGKAPLLLLHKKPVVGYLAAMGARVGIAFNVDVCASDAKDGGKQAVERVLKLSIIVRSDTSSDTWHVFRRRRPLGPAFYVVSEL